MIWGCSALSENIKAPGCQTWGFVFIMCQIATGRSAFIGLVLKLTRVRQAFQVLLLALVPFPFE
jgi:hypothetical protein